MGEELMQKLLTLSRDDASIWAGVAADGAGATKKGKKGKEPKPPKEPKGLIDPEELFKTGKEADKYDDYDAEGVPTTKAGGDVISDKDRTKLEKQWAAAKKAWDKHQDAVAQYEEEMKAFNEDGKEPLETAGGDDGGIPEAQKKISCEAASVIIGRQLVEKMIVEHADELATEIGRGDHDPDEFSEYVVREEFQEAEVITDPVLKAFRRVDEGRTNLCGASELKSIFAALGEDELEVNTHKFYADVSEADLDFVGGQLSNVGVEADGQLKFNRFKAFLEEPDVPTVVGKAPSSLIGCLTQMRVESWLTSGDVDNLYSPRSWRARIDEREDKVSALAPKTKEGGNAAGEEEA